MNLTVTFFMNSILPGAEDVERQIMRDIVGKPLAVIYYISLENATNEMIWMKKLE